MYFLLYNLSLKHFFSTQAFLCKNSKVAETVNSSHLSDLLEHLLSSEDLARIASLRRKNQGGVYLRVYYNVA